METNPKIIIELCKSLKELTMRLLKEEIIYHKSELYWYSNQKDINNTGKVYFII